MNAKIGVNERIGFDQWFKVIFENDPMYEAELEENDPDTVIHCTFLMVQQIQKNGHDLYALRTPAEWEQISQIQSWRDEFNEIDKDYQAMQGIWWDGDKGYWVNNAGERVDGLHPSQIVKGD